MPLTKNDIDESIERLLSLLKSSPRGAVFNPWWQVDAVNDIGPQAPGIRLWNAFPWHSFDSRVGMLSNRTPTNSELATGASVLQVFLDLFACARVVAVGRVAALTTSVGGCCAAPRKWWLHAFPPTDRVTSFV